MGGSSEVVAEVSVPFHLPLSCLVCFLSSTFLRCSREYSFVSVITSQKTRQCGLLSLDRGGREGQNLVFCCCLFPSRRFCHSLDLLFKCTSQILPCQSWSQHWTATLDYTFIPKHTCTIPMYPVTISAWIQRTPQEQLPTSHEAILGKSQEGRCRTWSSPEEVSMKNTLSMID